MYKYFFLFIFVIFLLIQDKQSIAHCLNPDSVYKSIEKSNLSDTVKAYKYVDFALQYRVGYPQLSISCLYKAIDIYENEGRKKDAAAIRAFMAQIYAQMGLYSIAAEHFIYAYKIYSKLDDNISLAWLYIDIGNLYFEVKKYDKARGYYQKSLERFNTDKHGLGISVNMLNFGLIKEKQGDFNAALFYYNECLKLRKQLDDIFLVAHIYSYIGRVYIELEDYDKAYSFLYNSIHIINELPEKIDLIKQQLYTDYNLLAQLFEKQVKTEMTFLYADTALKSAIQNTDTINMINGNFYLGQLYYKNSQYKEALVFLESALVLAEQFHKYDMLENIYLYLIKTELSIGNKLRIEKYISEFEKNKAHIDELQNTSKDENLDLAINSFLKELELEQAKRSEHIIKIVIYVSLIIFVVIIIIVAVFYYYKSRLLKNQRRLINTAFDGIVLHSKGIIYDVNESFIQFTGYTYKELINSSIYKYIDKNQHEEIKNNISTNKTALYLTKLKLKNDVWVNIEADAKGFDFEGKKMRLITIRDMTEKIKVQEQIQLFKTIIEQNFSSIIITDTNGKIEYVNPSFTRMTGYSQDEILGKNPRILKSGYHDVDFYKNMWKQIKSGMAWSGILKNKNIDGLYFWEETNITPIKDKEGNIIKYVAIKRDITKRKQLEDDIKTYNEHLKIIFEGLLALVIVIDYETEQIIFTNHKVDLIFGDVKEKHINDLIIDAEGVRTILLEKPIIDEVNKMEEYLKKEIYLSDKKLWYDVEFRLIKWVDGRKAVLLLADDITDKKNTIIALNALNASKDKFFSIISHDLRNPFQGLLGFSDILRHHIDFSDSGTVKMLAENIYSATKTSYELLEKLLEWAKLQKGTIQINKEKIILSTLVKELVKSLYSSANIKSLTIEINIDDKLMVYSDMFVLETVLRNLISNAIKFTPSKGLIQIISEVRNDEVLLYVKDNGIGIPQEILLNLFKIDTIYSILGTEGEKGSGLGLIICKELLELNGSKIFVESTYNKGSVFCFTLEVYS